MILAGVLVLLCGVACPPPSDGGTPIVDPTWPQQVVDLVNGVRTDNGLDPLVANELLAQVSRDYAQRMADLGFFDHTDPYNGQMVQDRATEAGYAFVAIGENIAAGQDSPQDVVDQWLNSPIHRANILSANFTETGVGIVAGGSQGICWVQMFGRPQ